MIADDESDRDLPPVEQYGRWIPTTWQGRSGSTWEAGRRHPAIPGKSGSRMVCSDRTADHQPPPYHPTTRSLQARCASPSECPSTTSRHKVARTTQQVEHLRRGGWLADHHIIDGAQLQEALHAR